MNERSKQPRLMVAAAMLLLAGCARTQLGSDLHKVDAACEDQNFKNKSGLVSCLTEQERPVWAKDEPGTLDLYDSFAQQRARLAQQYDSGAITQQQYSDRLDQIETDTRKQLVERRKQTATTQ